MRLFVTDRVKESGVDASGSGHKWP